MISKWFTPLNKKIMKFSFIASAFISTLAYAIPWIISNNLIPFPFNIIFLMSTLCFWLIILINIGKNVYAKHKEVIDDILGFNW